MSLNSLIPIDWALELNDTLEKDSIQSLFQTVERLYEEESILPNKKNLFLSLQLTDFDKTKAVILGQDPYPDKENAMGLAFSVNSGVRVPASLKNIYGEIERDLDIPMDKRNGNLISWAKQGVLLLNTSLTVQEKKANSHKYLNWIDLTSQIIRSVSLKETPVVFLLWGRNAQDLKYYIDGPNNLILETSHPSPLGASKYAPIPFMGSGIFSKTNKFLEKHGETPIDWRI